MLVACHEYRSILKLVQTEWDSNLRLFIFFTLVRSTCSKIKRLTKKVRYLSLSLSLSLSQTHTHFAGIILHISTLIEQLKLFLWSDFFSDLFFHLFLSLFSFCYPKKLSFDFRALKIIFLRTLISVLDLNPNIRVKKSLVFLPLKDNKVISRAWDQWSFGEKINF